MSIANDFPENCHDAVSAVESGETTELYLRGKGLTSLPESIGNLVELAELIVCTTGAMTKLVDRLERSGYVQRSPDPVDRRGVGVSLTASGENLASAAAETYRLGRERVLERLDDDEAEAIHDRLAQLLRAFEADRHGG